MATEAQTAFFSYSRDDSEFALRLAEDLKAAGASVWMDQLDLVGGQRWAEAVQEALEKCPRVLAILSPSAITSPNVMDEVTFALDERKTVIPVLYRDCKVPYRLRSLHHIDFRTDYARGLKALLRALAVEQRGAGGGVVSATLDGYDQMRLAERARLEEEREQAEQARLEQERKQREEAARLVAEAEREQREQAEAARFAAQAEAERKHQEEGARIAALAEAEGKQREEAARLAAQVETERKQREQAEAARLRALADEERKQREEAALLATTAEAFRKEAERVRLEAERKEAAERLRLDKDRKVEEREREHAGRPQQGREQGEIPKVQLDKTLPRYPGWWKGGITICALLFAASLLYWTASRPLSMQQATGSQKGQAANSEFQLRTEQTAATDKTAEDQNRASAPPNVTKEQQVPAAGFNPQPLTPQSGWAVGERGTILHTEDGGGTWKPQKSGTNGYLNSVAFVTPRSGWAVGYNGIRHTEDGGDSWQKQGSIGNGVPLSMTFVTPQSGWVVGTDYFGYGTILHTEDGGRSWQKQSIPTTDTNADMTSVTFVTPQSGWAVGQFGTILHTEDGGSGWQKQSGSRTGTYLNSVSFATPKSGWAVGRDGVILHTDDGGRNWEKQSSGTSSELRSVAIAAPR